MKDKYKIDDTFLAKWLSDDLSEEELLSFKESDDYELFEKIAKSSQNLVIPSKFRKEEVFQKIQDKINQKPKRKVIPLVTKWSYAIAAAVVILFGITFFLNGNETIESKTGDKFAYTLPDGSDVILNGDSKLVFDKRDWKRDKRILNLQGEGYFKVKKGSTFSVKTANGIVTVLGTQFNVLTGEEYLNVKCYEGKVCVKNDSGEVILTPGKGTYIKNHKFQEISFAQEAPLWLEDQYMFESAPLKLVLKAIENKYQVKIKTTNIDENELFTGKILGTSLESSLKSVCLPMHIKCTILDGLVELYR